MMILGSLRSLPTLAISTAAATLRLLASVNEAIAERLSPSPTPKAGVGGAPRRAASEAATAARQATAPIAPAPATTAPVTDIAALAGLPAPKVIAALDGLSTSELGDLYVYESGHRRRRTVLNALESAAAPPAAAEPDDLPPLDVRVADELVYSTSTPNT